MGRGWGVQRILKGRFAGHTNFLLFSSKGKGGFFQALRTIEEPPLPPPPPDPPVGVGRGPGGTKVWTLNLHYMFPLSSHSWDQGISENNY